MLDSAIPAVELMSLNAGAAGCLSIFPDSLLIGALLPISAGFLEALPRSVTVFSICVCPL